MVRVFRSRRLFSLVAAAVVTLVAMGSAHAADGWTLTGSTVRVKKVAFISVDVYAISHFMKAVPATKSKAAIIEAETDKKFVWTMSRDVEQEKIQDALRDGFAMNGYTDQAAIARFMAAFTKPLKEKTTVTISYAADKQETTLSIPGAGKATVAGSAFMRAVWSLWFGTIDQVALGDQLMSKMP